MSTIITTETNIKEQLLIEHNPKISRINDETITLLGNTPVGASQKVVTIDKPGTTMQFSLRTSETSFLDSCVRLEMEIPVKFNLTATNAATDPFVMMKSFEDVALRQYGLLNAIDSVGLTLNGKGIPIVTEVYRKFKAVSQYYDAPTILKKFPNSLPDTFIKYSQYDGIETIDSCDQKGVALKIKNTQYYPLNIFDNLNSYEYNSRRPYISNLTRLSGREVTGKMILTTFIPFSIFTLPDGSSQSMYGINDMNLQITLRSDWVRHLFCFKDNYVSSVEVYSDAPMKAHIHYKDYSPPSYIQQNLKNPNGDIKQYRLEMTQIVDPPSTTTQVIPPLTQAVKFNSNQLSWNRLPSKIYIYAIPKKSGTNIEQVADYYGRIEQLRVMVGSSMTLFDGLENIYQTCIENDLNVQRDAALYTNGFVVCLDLTKDLSIGADKLIGVSEKIDFQIEGLVRNLGDTAATFDVYFSPIFPAQLVYADRMFQLLDAVITNEFAFGEDNMVQRLYEQYEFTANQPVIGGSFLGTLFRGLKNIGKYVVNNPGKVAKFAQDAYKTISGSGNRGNNIIGGNSSTRTVLLGSGSVSNNIYK